MKKSDVNKVLKEAGYGFIKVQTGDWAKPEKCLTGFDGKRVKGIKGGSVGPTTVTSAYQERNQQVISEVTSSLKDIGMVEKDDCLVSPDGKISLSLGLVDYPQYTRSAGYDDAYRNYYVVPNFH
jgi:hypothetical protein